VSCDLVGEDAKCARHEARRAIGMPARAATGDVLEPPLEPRLKSLTGRQLCERGRDGLETAYARAALTCALVGEISGHARRLDDAARGLRHGDDGAGAEGCSQSAQVGVEQCELVGLVRRRKLLWSAYGLSAPWIAAGLVAGVIGAVRPVREWLADQRESACRAEGRSICSAREFDAACARRDLKLLGTPQQSICTGPSCTQRWVYRGPFRPDQLVVKGSYLCSIVDGTRSSIMAVADP